MQPVWFHHPWAKGEGMITQTELPILQAKRVLVQRPQWVCGHCGGYVKAIGACCPSCGAVLVGVKPNGL